MATMKELQKETRLWLKKSREAQKDTDFNDWYSTWKETASEDLILGFDYVEAWQCFNAGKSRAGIK